MPEQFKLLHQGSCLHEPYIHIKYKWFVKTRTTASEIYLQFLIVVRKSYNLLYKNIKLIFDNIP